MTIEQILAMAYRIQVTSGKNDYQAFYDTCYLMKKVFELNSTALTDVIVNAIGPTEAEIFLQNMKKKS